MVVQCEAVVEASKAKYSERPIAKKYREGKLKRPQAGEKSENRGE